MSAAGRGARGGDGLDFFPTNPRVTAAMLDAIPSRVFEGSDVVILDPAAGGGAILDVAKGRFRHARTFGIEIDAGRFEQLSRRHRGARADYLSDQAWGETHLLANQPFDLTDPFTLRFLARFLAGVRLVAWLVRSAWFDAEDTQEHQRKRHGKKASPFTTPDGRPCEGRCRVELIDRLFAANLRRWTISPRPPFDERGTDATAYEWAILCREPFSPEFPQARMVRWEKERIFATCPVCAVSDTVMPAWAMPRPEGCEGLPLGCAACGNGIAATARQLRAHNARERRFEVSAETGIPEDQLAERARSTARKAAAARKAPSPQIALPGF